MIVAFSNSFGFVWMGTYISASHLFVPPCEVVTGLPLFERCLDSFSVNLIVSASFQTMLRSTSVHTPLCSSLEAVKCR